MAIRTTLLASFVMSLAAGIASAQPTGPVADHIQKLNDAVSTGDLWNATVPKFVAVLGAPNLAGANRLGWFILDKETCHAITLTGDGEFVTATRFTSLEEISDDSAACKAQVGKHAKLPPLPADRRVDVDTPAKVVMAQWRDGQFQRLYDAAHPDLRKELGSPSAIAHIAELFAPITGKFVRLGSPLQHVTKDFGWYVTGPAIFENGTLAASIGFRLVDGKPRLVRLDLMLPKQLQRKPDPAEAAKLGRHALDLLLAGDVAAFMPLTMPVLAQQIRALPDLPGQLRTVVHKLGKVGEIKLGDQHECDGRQCLTFEIHTSNGSTTATFTTAFNISRWELWAFNLDPPVAK
jgi:hypothetical protein